MNHGTAVAYLTNRCRCTDCHAWNYRRVKRYRLLTGAGEDGRPQRALTVDVVPIREHVATLVASGWTRTHIADELGHTVYWLWSVLDHTRSKDGSKRIRRDIADAILAVEPLEPVDVDPVVVERLTRCEDWRGVPRTDAERDAAIRAMDAAGVSRNEIARVTHLNSATLYRALRAEAVA